MPSWSDGEYLGVKLVNVFPANAEAGRPALSSAFVLASATTGEHLAVIDGNELTRRRTVATSALAASYLARARSISIHTSHSANPAISPSRSPAACCPGMPSQAPSPNCARRRSRTAGPGPDHRVQVSRQCPGRPDRRRTGPPVRGRPCPRIRLWSLILRRTRAPHWATPSWLRQPLYSLAY
jgi:hypothetical protein